MEKVQFTLRIDPELLQKIRLESAERKISMSDIIVEKMMRGEKISDKKNNIPRQRSR